MADSLEQVHERMRVIAEFGQEEQTVILVGNGSDCISERQITFEQAKRVADKYKVMYVETSAKTSKNIEEILEITSLILVANRPTSGRTLLDGINLLAQG
eukprot:CAMPEP_0115028906 /NCGR_PEP_ID=MMETSP0216-20121206/36637_1 /TAXON_ID=223996 /ORGANISM="Protocruzia adherens, Strain Boccale" /LENGTH=99 /DNA_ID=CAMNT_0002405295 /DNA_START=208 /DNA_END=507 /DNA_ORIENTATION=-